MWKNNDTNYVHLHSPLEYTDRQKAFITDEMCFTHLNNLLCCSALVYLIDEPHFAALKRIIKRKMYFTEL
jgi:hypothetical protein